METYPVPAPSQATRVGSSLQLMRKIALISLILLLAGAWLAPRLSNAGDISATAAPASTQPSAFEQIKGQEGFWRLAKTRDGVRGSSPRRTTRNS